MGLMSHREENVFMVCIAGEPRYNKSPRLWDRSQGPKEDQGEEIKLE